MKTMCPACKGKGDIDRERATPQPPMSIEICIHGTDITNKLGIACPEGCLSNAQRGLENRQLAMDLLEARAEVNVLMTKLLEFKADVIVIIREDWEHCDIGIVESLIAKIQDL